MATDYGWDNGFDPWGQQDCDGEIGEREKRIDMSANHYVIN